MAYQTELYKEIFWAESGDFIRGRDPLGIQNSSIATYSSLLPGMTNLTLRIRYYGFYLWLLQEYHLLPNDSPFKKNYQSHYNFIRRAELIMAYVMVNQFPDVLNIVGSDFAFNNKGNFYNGYYDIERGADKGSGSEKLYWKYSSGAFGQYYVGALINFNLVHPNQELFFVKTEKGDKMANAFRKSISGHSLKVILDCILTGKLFIEQMEVLQEFALHKIPPLSEELNFYQSLLIEDDNITSNFPQKQRVETILCFLRDVDSLTEKNEWGNFPFRIYLQNGFIGQPHQTEASIGWYYYYLNELVHYSLETIFWGLLREMDKKEPQMQTFIAEIKKNVIEQIGIQGDILVSNVNLALKAKSVEEYLKEISQFIKHELSIKAIASSISMLFDLYKTNITQLATLEKYATNHFLSDKRGNVIGVFNQLFIKQENKKLEDFVANLLIKILNDHIAVALDKMAGREQNLLKFIIEDNRLVHIETMKPNFTSPRLKTLHNFLTDLHFLDNSSNLTEMGKDFLTRLN